MIRGDNLVVNPSGSLQLNNWTTSGTITVNDGFEMTNDSSMSQLYDAGSPEIPPNAFELSAVYRLTQLQSRLTASFGKKLYIVLTYNDGYIDTLVLPLRIDVSIPDHTQGSWLYVKGTIDLNVDVEGRELENIQIVVSCESLVGTLIIKDISLITLTEEVQATTGDIQDSVDVSMEEHLNDITNNHLSDEQKDGLTGGATRLKTIKLGLQDNVQVMNQNLYNNIDPLVTLEVVRKNTPIITPQYWQELLVSTAASVTSTSVAVEKSGSGIGKVYVAYVTNGTLVVKSAQFGYPISEMLWTVEETIPGCSQCALDFDGHFVRQDDGTIIFVTDTIPYLFYMNSSNSMWYKKVGDAQNPLLGANVTSLDVIRGISSERGEYDNGLIVFYVVGGQLYYNSLIAGSWEGQTLVSLAPSNVVSVKAERTWDFRICLHVTDTDGKLYEIFSKMEISGWIDHGATAVTGARTLTQYLTQVNYSSYQHDPNVDTEAVAVNNAIGNPWNMSIYAPVLMSARNIETDGDYGLRVEFEFDQYLFNAEAYPAQFVIIDSLGLPWYGQSAVRNRRIVTVTFLNFNNATNPITARAKAGVLTNGYIALAQTDVEFNATGLVPYYVEPPVLVSYGNIQDWSET